MCYNLFIKYFYKGEKKAMNKKLKSIAWLTVLCVILTAVYCPLVSAELSETDAASKLAAFPCAEGGGMWTTGARGGENIEVYHVTKLTDDGSKGTFRDAVSQSNRVIVFDVAGNIELSNAVNILGSNLTILGQTAPGDGICIKNNTVALYGDNVIIRYLRFRMGDEATVEDDSIGGRGRKNVIIDHCSMSWSTDECASFYENENFTMQWCIISESLKESVHAKGSHGYGGIWGGKNASFHHNLIADHDSRNPRIDKGNVTGDNYDMTTQTELTDLRNNVIYNWGGNSAYGGQAGAPVNIINCYYKSGPATGSHKSRIFECSSSGNDVSYTWSTDLYVDGNYVSGYPNVTTDNSKGVDKDSASTKSYIWTADTIKNNNDAKNVHFKYENGYPVTTQKAEEAYESVLAEAGASMVRDSVDNRIIDQVKNGTGNLINSQTEVGGYPKLEGTKAKDSDNDGMPNEWEDKNELNKREKSDALALAENGYLNIENYANALADGSYVRNTEYDPEIPDYEPSDDPEPSTEPSETPKPPVEFVSEWKPSSKDLNKENLALMPGLTNVIAFDREMSDTVIYSDGSKYSYAVTRKNGDGINGGWDAEKGVSKGTGLKFTASDDGIFTLYGYSVSGEKNFYIMPEGVNIDPKVDLDAFKNKAVYIQQCIGSSVPIFCEVEFKAGQTYYIYLDGSKMRFCYAKFEKYVKQPYSISGLSADENGVTVNVTKNMETENGSIIIAAYYDSDEIVQDVRISEIPQNAEVGTPKPYAINRGVKSGEKVKAFVWNSTNAAQPLADIKEFNP